MDTINLKAPHLGLSGEYRAVLYNEDGSVAYDSGWDKNLITTRGEYLYSHHVAFQSWFTYCHIGTSDTAPNVSDTTLGAWLADSSSVINTDPGNSYNGGSPNYERWQTKTWRFVAGVGTGLVQEMGLGTINNDPSYLFSHHLLDTPINKAANQTLDVSYRFTAWPSIIETEVNSVLIGGVNYTCRTSFYNATNTAFAVFNEYTPASNSCDTYDGIKAALTASAPSGDNGTSSTSPSMNTNGTGITNISAFFGLTIGNTPLNIVKTAVFRMNNGFNIQTEFEAEDGPDIGGGIPKDATKEMTLNWQLTWGERP